MSEVFKPRPLVDELAGLRREYAEVKAFLEEEVSRAVAERDKVSDGYASTRDALFVAERDSDEFARGLFAWREEARRASSRVVELEGSGLELDDRLERAAKRLRAAWIGASIAGDYGMMLGLGAAFEIAFPELELDIRMLELET